MNIEEKARELQSLTTQELVFGQSSSWGDGDGNSGSSPATYGEPVPIIPSIQPICEFLSTFRDEVLEEAADDIENSFYIPRRANEIIVDRIRSFKSQPAK